MSLDWFPFNIKDFLANTKRLNTEAKGAYLCLMLDYYEQECGPPDDDDVLAAITELPLDAWKRHRKVISPLFETRDGYWHHARMDAEIADALDKMRKAKERSEAGVTARWGADRKPAKPKKNAKSIPQALPEALPQESTEQCYSDAHLTLNTKDSLSSRERAGDLVDQEEPQEPRAPAPSIGGPIPEGWQPDPEWVQETLDDGVIVQAEITAELKKFVADKQDSGAFSNNWDASWTIWWSRYLDWKAKQKKPKPQGAARVEVEMKREPSEAEFRKGLEWKRKGMMWMRSLGPEPGDNGCKCPPELILEYGFDPKTGLALPS